MSLEACLPAELQGPTTTITRIAGGLSGTGVYRVEAAGQPFVLKIASEDEPLAGWRCKLAVQQLAAGAGLAPRVIHADEARRAIVSAFVVDRGAFPARFGDPRTRDAALALLGRTVRRVHELPVPPEAELQDPREILTAVWSQLATDSALPGFVGDTVQRVLSEDAPERAHALVLSHNDMNPTNLVHDGEQLVLLDWDTAGPNDRYYDLAATSVFFRMDDETCGRLLAAYEGEAVAGLPARFVYNRRLVAALCGAMFLYLARHGGHAGTAEDTLDATPDLSAVYQRMRAGSLDPTTGEGKWHIGLALIKASAAL